MMRRRELMLLLAGAMTGAPRSLHAHQKTMPVIGFLGIPSPGPFGPYVALFHEGLGELVLPGISLVRQRVGTM
jgi:hypothetical protein